MRKFRVANPAGYTLIELLIVVGIIGIMIGLLMPAVQRLRDSAQRTQCCNNLRQLGIAVQTCNDTQGTLPPLEGAFQQADAGSLLFHLLPYLEQNNLYLATGVGDPPRCNPENGADLGLGKNGVVKAFLCPSDASYRSRAHEGNWAATADGGYAGNFQVFGRPGSVGTFTNGDWAGDARIPTSFADGTANTLIFADKYSNCEGPDPSGILHDGGNRWAGHGGDAWSPAFAVPNLGSDSTGLGSYFQSRPDPYVGGCDPTRASSGHTEGITVGLADGSARLLSKNISPATWWAVCTPAGGEVLDSDW
jgi:prepilin-type N-terminal cleavage/methylation domain-containing protein